MPSIQVPPQAIRQLLPGQPSSLPALTQLAEGVQQARTAVAQVKTGVYLIRDIQVSAASASASKSAQPQQPVLTLQGTQAQLILQLPEGLKTANWLKAGQWVSLLSAPGGQLQLKPAGADLKPEIMTPVRAALAHASLRRWIPLEQPLAVSLRQFQALPVKATNAAITTGSGLAPVQSPGQPTGLEAVHQRLLSALPRADALATPEGVKQALEFSGLWSEQRLASGAGGSIDFKLLLLDTLAQARQDLRLSPNQVESLFRHDFPQGAESLIAQLAQAFTSSARGTSDRKNALDVGQWLHVLARMLTRVHVQQLNSLAASANQPDPAAPQTLWVAELPWQHKGQADVLELKVARREVSKGPRGRLAVQWQVTLAFPWEDAGTLHARILYCDAQVSAHFWAPDAMLCQKVGRQSSVLAAGLRRWGLSVGEISAQVGEPPAEQRGVSRHYIDTRV